MRVSLTLGAFLLALAAVAPVSAQAKKEKEKVSTAPTSRTVLSSLQVEIGSKEFANLMRFSELLQLSREKLQTTGQEVTFALDDEAYRDENPEAPRIYESEIHLKSLPPKTTVMYLLRQALKQLPVKSAIVVRSGRVDIVPLSRTSKEYMLNQTFHVDLKDRPLTLALEELSDLTGVSIVIDARAKQKAQSPVTARFHDDVALQDAVRMLTEMAELKIVYLVTGIYITTPEHANVMQTELKQLYEGPQTGPTGGFGLGGVGKGPFAPGGGFGGVPGGGGLPLNPDMNTDRQNSPLAPPLPPARRRMEAAPA
jgi:hypothetical protein